MELDNARSTRRVRNGTSQAMTKYLSMELRAIQREAYDKHCMCDCPYQGRGSCITFMRYETQNRFKHASHETFIQQ